HNICSGRRFLCVQGATDKVELPQLQVTLWGYLQVTLERSEQRPIFDLRCGGKIFDGNIVRLPGHDVCERIADNFFSADDAESCGRLCTAASPIIAVNFESKA